MTKIESLSQYEIIGNRAARFLKSIEGSAGAKLYKSIKEFVRKYESSPLFVVGLDEGMIESITEEWKKGDRTEVLTNFRLPYPTMVLDFPKGVSPGRPEDPCIMFIDTISPNRYYIEVLRTEESYQKRLDSASQIERSMAEALHRSDSQQIGEAVATILYINPECPEKSEIITSCEYLADCQIPVIPNDDVTGYCIFSSCAPANGQCAIKTPMCRVAGESTSWTVFILAVVLAYINRPDRYVIKITPEKTAREKRLQTKAKVPSFSKKETHIVLDHSQVREVFSAGSSDKGTLNTTVLPHHRRGHWRQLQADCFKEKKMVWVRPADINKGMAVKIKNSIYEIVT